MAPIELSLEIFLDIIVHGFVDAYFILFGILFIFRGRKEDNTFLKGLGIGFILLALSDFLATYSRSFYLGLTLAELAADPVYVLLWRALSIFDQLALFAIAYVVGGQTIEGYLVPNKYFKLGSIKIPLFWLLPIITLPNMLIHLVFLPGSSNWLLLPLLSTIIILLFIILIYLRLAFETEAEFRRMALAFAGGIFCIGWARALTGTTFINIAAALLLIDPTLHTWFTNILQLIAALLFLLAILLIAYSNLFKAD
ncbi:MAG: hypothetical protein ACFFCZ_03700 [Promethearchaeota archaeon]